MNCISYNGMLHSNKTEWAVIWMGEPHKHQAECKKPDSKEHILYDFIYFTYLKHKPGKK